MLFNSLPFLLLFLPLAWGGFQLCARIGHHTAVGWLVGVSLLFYGWCNPVYLILLCGSIIFNYAAGLLIQKWVTKPAYQEAVLALGVGGNLSLLCYYKYLFPLLHWADQFGIHIVAPEVSILLPVGISFFTFTQIGYLVDCKAGITVGSRFLDYSLFVTFFPHLVAGPILHHREMMPQFEDKGTLRFNPQNIAIGLTIFFIGLAKKDLIADFFAGPANDGFNNAGRLGLVEAWSSALSYSVQLYYDFSGYSEMAIGLALLFNIRFPANFDSPYKSASIIDFWQRWHMTLSRYLNLYMYNPIALWVARRRAQSGLPVGRQGLKSASGFISLVAFPTFFTMTLVGIWHGAGYNFIIYGLLHAVYLTINHGWRLLFHQKNAPQLTGPALWFSTTWKVILTYLAVVVSLIFFRAASVSQALDLLASMAGCHPQPIAPAYEVYIHVGKRLIGVFLLIWMAPNVLQVFAQWNPSLSKPHATIPAWLQWRPTPLWAVAMALVAVVAFLAVSGQTEFLYFHF